jgi:hypothetical protein
MSKKSKAKRERQREHIRRLEQGARAVAATPERRLPFPPLWPEIAEAEQATLDPKSRPPLNWRQLEREAAETRQHYIEHPQQWRDEFGTAHYKTFGTASEIRDATPDQFDLRNVQHFQALPSIQAWKKQCAMGVALTFGVIQKRSQDVVAHIVQQVRAEQAHLLYHQAMWRGHGRRVYVLDRTTYELLAATPLPNLPASILSMPFHSFYLKLPERAFQFEVGDTRTGQHDIGWAEGVVVSMDKIDPDYDGTRELAFCVMSEHSDQSPDFTGFTSTMKSEGRNTAFISVRLGPDARLSQIKFAGGVRALSTDLTGPIAGSYADTAMAGASELGEMMPRVILGLLLYLASEHPDVQPIDPAPRRDVDSMHNPAKRRKAEQQNARQTRLQMLYVGRKVHEEVEREKETVRAQLMGQGRTLDHPVWVRGHWRLQPMGVGRMLRKTIWIRPYVKGPDVAESLTIRAAKIQRAEHAGA